MSAANILAQVVFPHPAGPQKRYAFFISQVSNWFCKIILMLSYPSDEVGNHLISLDMLDEANIDPYMDVLTLKEEGSYQEEASRDKHQALWGGAFQSHA